MKKKYSLSLIIFVLVELLLFSVTPVYAALCEKHTFAEEVPGLNQFYFYSDGRSWEFAAENDMAVICIETKVRLGGSGANIKIEINGQELDSWHEDLTTTYTYYLHESSTNFQLNSGDTITFVISGGTLSTPGGAVADGDNYVMLCDGACTCDPPQINYFTGPTDPIQPGELVDLSWSISDATSANIDQGIGSVDPASGTRTVSPNTTTTYTLTANNDCGSINESVTVTVSNPLEGTISGRITDSSGNPIANLHVGVRDDKCWTGNILTAGASTDADGYYIINGVPVGNVYIRTGSLDNGQHVYVEKWWDGDTGTIYCDQALAITVQSSQNSDGINITTEIGGTISGRIIDTGGNPIANLHVELRDDTCWEGHVITDGAPTDNDGYFNIVAVPAGMYYIHTVAGINGQNCIDKWWDGDEGTIHCEQALGVVVSSGQNIGDINMTLNRKTLSWLLLLLLND